MDHIGKDIKARRTQLGVTQRQLSLLSGISINTLTKIERGEGNPTISAINRVLDTLGLVLTTRIKEVGEI